MEIEPGGDIKNTQGGKNVVGKTNILYKNVGPLCGERKRWPLRIAKVVFQKGGGRKSQASVKYTAASEVMDFSHIARNWGNQGAEGHSGRTTIPHTWSVAMLCSIAGIRDHGGLK